MWRPSSSRSPPQEIEDALYGTDEDEEGQSEIDDDIEEDDPALVFENLSSPRAEIYNDVQDDNPAPEFENWSSPRAPSYSPLSSPILIEVPADVAEEEEEEGAFSADAHLLYLPPPESALQQQPTRAARGRQRSVRGGRTRERGAGRTRRGIRGARVASSAAHVWSIGEPIVQVCVTDEDVPAPLREMVESLVRTRRERDTLQAARTARRDQQQQQQQRQHEENDDFYDAEDDGDAVLLEGRNSFEWRPMDSFVSQKEVFIPSRTGSLEPYHNICDAFRSFWPESILQDIVLETNRYASEIVSAGFQRDWYETNIHELLMLFGFWMMLGIIKMPTIKSCFSTNPLLSTDVFRLMFTQKRDTHLVRALHFADNSVRPPNASRLYCLGSVLDHLNDAFKRNYVPGPNVSIDESLTLWKGSLSFRQYIRTKAARFGIKTFELCDSVTGYLWSFIVYTGKDPSVRSTQSALLKSTSVVLDLIQPLLHKGYCLYMDKWFNSPTLARYLKSKSTDCVGTLRASRCGVPALVQQADLQRGQMISRHCGDVVVQAWQDKKK